MTVIYCMSIAGSDPTGGAGIQADMAVFRAMGVHGLSAIAALTAQNTQGVRYVEGVSGSTIRTQIEILLEDFNPSALKTGMLLTKDAVEAVADSVKKHALANLVIDPVTVSSSGATLLEPDALETLRKELIPLARVITPNLNEAAALSGLEVKQAAHMLPCAKALVALGAEAVIITGGHIEGDRTLELVYEGGNYYEIEGRKAPGDYHGTGCAFSASLCASLALGKGLVDAATGAAEFVKKAIKHAHHTAEGRAGLLSL